MPIVCAFATSHAYTFQDPETWDQRRERSKKNVERKAGRPASDTADARAETLEDNRRRYAHIRDAHRMIRERLAQAKADAVLLVGDDQTENFGPDNLPQLLVYTGEDYVAALEGTDRQAYDGYLEAFRHGMPPHGGFAIGLERWTARLVGAANIREVTLFPRDVNRLTP